MRYCPQGDGAFDDWVAACPECGATLLDVPGTEHDIEPDDDRPPVFLQMAPNEVEAGMTREILRDAGIPVLLRPEGPGIGAWASAATMQHAVYVRAADLDRARDILSEIEIVEGDEWAFDDENGPEDDPDKGR